MTEIIDLNDDNFNAEVLEHGVPVLVDFTAVWCGPCHQLKPVVEEIASEQSGTLRVGSLDIDHNMNTTMQYGVMGVPTLILFKDGKPVERLQGFMPKPRIMSKLTPHLG